MKHLIRNTVILASFSLGAQAMAASKVYECEVVSQTNDGFVPPVTLISLDAKTKQAAVYDGFIKAMQDEPMLMEAKLLSKGKYRMRYRVKVQTSNSGKLAVSYSLRFDQGRMTYSINGVLHGSDNRIGAAGTCKPLK